MYRFLFVLVSFFSLSLISCNSASSTSSTAPNSVSRTETNLPEVLKTSLKNHGGLALWDSMNSLTFTLEKDTGKEVQQIDLKSRKVKISQQNWTLGFDGSEVWVAPNLEAFGKGSPRFYHNLYFYFFSLPYVLADPGINYEVLPQRVLNGKSYNVLKITFNENVGDAPDDYYIAHFDAKTGLLHLLLYTVTYYDQATNEKFKALIYEDWKKFNGLYLPQTLKGYKYAADTLGEPRYARNFVDINIDTKTFDPTIFEMPKGAEIDSLISVE